MLSLVKRFVLTSIVVISCNTVVSSQSILEKVENETVMTNTDNTKEERVVRVYRYRNSRVRKELKFRTKKDRPQLA